MNDTDRPELLARARRSYRSLSGGIFISPILVADLADALEASLPRVVTTAAELDACRVGAVVVDAVGYARTKLFGENTGWTYLGGDAAISSVDLADGSELLVIHEGLVPYQKPVRVAVELPHT
jgi:hypothetical protein